MPWGLTRFQQSGQSHFVTFCCYHRCRLFTTPEESSSQGETSHPKIAKSAIFRMGHPAGGPDLPRRNSLTMEGCPASRCFRDAGLFEAIPCHAPDSCPFHFGTVPVLSLFFP